MYTFKDGKESANLQKTDGDENIFKEHHVVQI